MSEKLSSLNADWGKAGRRTSEAMSEHIKKGNHQSSRGWVKIGADIAGIVAAVATEAYVYKFPVVNVVLPPLVGYGTKKLVEWGGNKILDYYEKKAESPARPAALTDNQSNNFMPVPAVAS